MTDEEMGHENERREQSGGDGEYGDGECDDFDASRGEEEAYQGGLRAPFQEIVEAILDEEDAQKGTPPEEIQARLEESIQVLQGRADDHPERKEDHPGEGGGHGGAGGEGISRSGGAGAGENARKSLEKGSIEGSDLEFLARFRDRPGCVVTNRWSVLLGKCEEILPGLPRVGLVCTDPPYGIGKWSSGGGNSLTEEECESINKWDATPSDDTMRMMVSKAEESIVWGGNYLCGAIGPFRTPLIWDKSIRGMHYADGELAWTNFAHGALRLFNLPAPASDARGDRQHPTQKPVALMLWCIGLSRATGVVLDPFAGSGTTGVAALRLGRRCILIEKDPKYAAICVERMRAEESQSTLAAQRAGQRALWPG